MKVGVMMCAFKEERLIVPAIRQFDNIMDDLKIDEIVVACSKSPWFGSGKADNTCKLAVEAGATTRLFDWKDEKDQKNWIMDKMKDKDYVLMFAPDMYMTTESLNNALYFLRNATDRAYACDIVTYWKDYDTVIVPSIPFNTVAVRSDERFIHSATLANSKEFTRLPGALMHHLSWVKTDEEIKKKISTYSHANEIATDWYDRVWKKWHKDMTDFNPTNPVDFKGVIEYSLPEEIRELLKKYENIV